MNREAKGAMEAYIGLVAKQVQRITRACQEYLPSDKLAASQAMVRTLRAECERLEGGEPFGRAEALAVDEVAIAVAVARDVTAERGHLLLHRGKLSLA